MRLRDVESNARRLVPGDGVSRLSLLSEGLSGCIYKVERDDRAFSMRVAGSARNNRWLERVLRVAAEHGLAPPLVSADVKRGIIVQDWVEGRAWTAAAAKDARCIERIAALLRRVHALPVPTPARCSNPAKWVRHYGAELDAQRLKRRRAERATALALAVAAKKRLRRLTGSPKITGVVCHSDLHRLNLLESRRPNGRRNSLLLLDWEYAHVSDPFWDLAGWSANNDFPDELLRPLLAAYLGRPAKRWEWERCKLLVWLYDYVCLLWTELYLNSRRGRAGSEMALRALVLQSRLIEHREI